VASDPLLFLTSKNLHTTSTPSACCDPPWDVRVLHHNCSSKESTGAGRQAGSKGHSIRWAAHTLVSIRQQCRSTVALVTLYSYTSNMFCQTMCSGAGKRNAKCVWRTKIAAPAYSIQHAIRRHTLKPAATVPFTGRYGDQRPAPAEAARWERKRIFAGPTVTIR
jgi:hypothetical protein